MLQPSSRRLHRALAWSSSCLKSSSNLLADSAWTNNLGQFCAETRALGRHKLAFSSNYLAWIHGPFLPGLDKNYVILRLFIIIKFLWGSKHFDQILSHGVCRRVLSMRLTYRIARILAGTKFWVESYIAITNTKSGGTVQLGSPYMYIYCMWGRNFGGF